MRIGIFEGSFNLPHKVHKKIATSLGKYGYLDKVIFVPTGNRYKKKELVDAKDRFHMLSLMVKDCINLEVSSYEIQDYLVYTYQTLDYFQKKYVCDEIYFICGSDNLNEIAKWKNFEEILTKYKILVIKRDKENLDSILEELKGYQENIILIPYPFAKVSSTFVRGLIKSSQDSVSNYVTADVLDYIKKISCIFDKFFFQKKIVMDWLNTIQ